ncbi:MAG: DUF4349 domain-containing protein [Candidatus Moraniibacteriota bacterium]|nr:MAG: DUF4349 domain-containing protein [Candidatus Moranbacteria bacterium]
MDIECIKKWSKSHRIIVASIIFVLVVVFVLIVNKKSNLGTFSSYEQGLSGSTYENVAGQRKNSLPMGVSPENTSFESSLVSDQSSLDVPVSQNEIMMGVEKETEQQKIIKEGDLTLKIKNVDITLEEIRGVVEYHKGIIFGTQINRDSQGLRRGVITVKVPVDAFDGAMIGIKEKALLVLYENTTGQDITDQYVDLQARLKNKQAEETAFIKIMADVKDSDSIIKVTKELSRVRGEIERLQAQIRNLEAKTDMSTIRITISEDQEITLTDTWRPWQEVKDRVNELLDSFRSTVNFFIVLFVWFLPLLIVWGIIFVGTFFLVRKIYRKFLQKK